MTGKGRSTRYVFKKNSLLESYRKSIYVFDQSIDVPLLKRWITCKDFLQVQKEGERQVQRTRKFYNLYVIISVGCRIKSHIDTSFRQWAPRQLREYIVKGFVVDDVRLN